LEDAVYKVTRQALGSSVANRPFPVESVDPVLRRHPEKAPRVLKDILNYQTAEAFFMTIGFETIALREEGERRATEK
jgi:hypothetical protein